MGRCRVVAPESVRLPLSDGDFLTVKKELNAGEYIDAMADGAAGNFFAVQLAYLIAWSLVGLDDAPVPYTITQPLDERRAALRSLDVATLKEISAAIEAHASANAIAVQEKKTTPALAVAS